MKSGWPRNLQEEDQRQQGLGTMIRNGNDSQDRDLRPLLAHILPYFSIIYNILTDYCICYQRLPFWQWTQLFPISEGFGHRGEASHHYFGMYYIVNHSSYYIY